MLSATIKDTSLVRFPVMISPKLDGIRALVVNDTLVSRKLKPIPNHHVRNALSHLDGFDGELISGHSAAHDAYRKTMSAVMTQEGTPRVTFWVFDNWHLGDHRFKTRFATLPERESADIKVTVRRVRHEMVHNEEDLLYWEQYFLALGYEGIMLRDPDGLYKRGRSTLIEGGLSKLKRFEDSEAEVLGIVEQLQNGNEATLNALGNSKRSSHKANMILKGTTGALLVRDLTTGVEFQIGTGMDDATRAEFWSEPPIGRFIKYKFQPVGVKDKPRFPVFLGVRDKIDL